MNDLELYHHGVKGQKWGVRRYQNADGSLTRLGKARHAAETFKESRKARSQAKKNERAAEKAKKAEKDSYKKNPKDMSDDELREKIARLELEKSYNKAYQEVRGTPKTENGKKFINDVLYKSGKNISEQLATSLFGNATNAALKQIFPETWKDYTVNPKKGQKDK